MVVRVGLDAELAAIRVWHPKPRVGLAASKTESGRSEPRPRCDNQVIQWVVLDLAGARVRWLGCNCGVCVGIEYFNYACRHLPTPNFFAPYFCAKPYLTVQKMPNSSNLNDRVGILPQDAP